MGIGEFSQFPIIPTNMCIYSIGIAGTRKDEKMSGKENKKVDEKTYTLDEIRLDLRSKQGDDLENDGLTEQNVSGILKRLLEDMGLPDAKKVLRAGKGFAFTEQEKELIECLILERQGKLKRHKKGKHKGEIVEPDFEFLFGIMNGIRAMLIKRGYDVEKLYDEVEEYMTSFLSNEASVAITISQKLQKMVERNIVDKNTYIRTFDKFIWMRAMEEELSGVADKWDAIFREYEKLMKAEVCDKIEEMYHKPYGATGENEIPVKTNEQIFNERVSEHLENKYKEKWEMLDKKEQKFLADRERKEKYYDDKEEYYRNHKSKSATARASYGQELFKIKMEIEELNKEIEQISIQRSAIYRNCQELAYDELYGGNEKIPVVGLPDTREILWKAKENVSGKRGNSWILNNMGEKMFIWAED